MLDYERTDVSKEIDFSKTIDLRDCMICYYWYFLKINFKFRSKVCNSCDDLMQKAMNFNDVVILSVKENY